MTDLDLYQPTAFQIGLEEVVAEFAEEERYSKGRQPSLAQQVVCIGDSSQSVPNSCVLEMKYQKD